MLGIVYIYKNCSFFQYFIAIHTVFYGTLMKYLSFLTGIQMGVSLKHAVLSMHTYNGLNNIYIHRTLLSLAVWLYFYSNPKVAVVIYLDKGTHKCTLCSFSGIAFKYIYIKCSLVWTQIPVAFQQFLTTTYTQCHLTECNIFQ